jgi:hypothetical protein
VGNWVSEIAKLAMIAIIAGIEKPTSRAEENARELDPSASQAHFRAGYNSLRNDTGLG